jgi:putative transposase
MQHINDNSISYGRGYVYKLQYHIVWCVKYRRRVLTDGIEVSFKAELLQAASGLGVKITAMECMPDHIHLLLDCTPQHFIPTVVKILKGNTARRLFLKYPELKSKLWDGHLWNPSYFVVTVSENTSEQITEYIQKQKTK